MSWVALEGLPGAGKTTTASLLGEALGVTPVLERSDLHPFLTEYFADPGRYAMETELVFMGLHLFAMNGPDVGDEIVSDFSPGKDAIFAAAGMASEQAAVVARLEAGVWGTRRPDVTVFLSVPPSVCRERIMERGRPFEQAFTVPALERVERTYKDRLEGLGDRVLELPLTGVEARDVVLARVMQLAGLDRGRSAS